MASRQPEAITVPSRMPVKSRRARGTECQPIPIRRRISIRPSRIHTTAFSLTMMASPQAALQPRRTALATARTHNETQQSSQRERKLERIEVGRSKMRDEHTFKHVQITEQQRRKHGARESQHYSKKTTAPITANTPDISRTPANE